MSTDLTPMRWPSAWKDAAPLELLKDTPINALVVEKGADLGPVAAQARQSGITLVDAAAPPPGVDITKGEWPGVQSPRAAGNEATGGPTGNPWVDSNGWKIRLESALKHGKTIWVDAAPKDRVFPDSYVMAFADSASHGGRWIITLDDQFAGTLAQKQPQALDTWKKLAAAADFFNKHKAWNNCAPAAVMGIVSSFAGDNEFMGQELCNLVARTNQQYRIVLKDQMTPASLAGLKAIIYADAEAPSAALKGEILQFVQTGGTLITGPKWGPPPGTPAKYEDHRRYNSRVLGKGKVAIAKADLDDPYVVANDAVVIFSHRYELLRFWNGGSVGSYYTVAPDKKRAVVHLLFYSNRGPASMAIRVVGKFRSGNLLTLDRKEPRAIEMVQQKDAVELHLPGANQYAAAELEA